MAPPDLLAMARRLISMPRGPKSLGGLIASGPPEQRTALIEALSPNALAALPFLFEFWGRADHQLPPEAPWTTWVVLGGRGSGKTRTGTEWVRRMVEGGTPLQAGAKRRVALLAETWEQAREVMVQGESGFLACSPADRRPAFISTRRMLRWPNGAEAHLFSAVDPEALRGPQFDCAWSDELAKWRLVGEAWDMLQFGLRLGDHPQQIVTTTPRDVPVLHAILADPATVMTTAPTAANRANLAADFFDHVVRRYEGTTQGRQELEGVLLTERDNALFSRRTIDRARLDRAPRLDRIVVAVDPPASHGERADECGIIVAGRAGDDFYVLEDRSIARATPSQWAAAAIAAYRHHAADRIVAEINQGGDMVIDTLRHADPMAAVSSVRATHGKTVRAEPVSLLYERGLVHHVGLFTALEDQLVELGHTARSPDRADALVWAITELMAERTEPKPRARFL
jgi:phage terminase large subunit-like protein